MRSTTKTALIGVLAAAGFVAARALRSRNFYDPNGKVALITGGSRGLGLVLARELAKRGCRIAICARDEDELARAKADLSGRGVDVEAFVCDVTDPASVKELIGDVLHHFGEIDILINNAGIIHVAPLELQTRTDFEETMATHFWGSYNTIESVLPTMKRKGSGRIVNIASFGGKIAVPHLVSYSASKFALVGLSHGMRSELMKDGIVVTTVCPGLMRTGSHINAEFKGKKRAEYAMFSIMDALPVTSVSAEHAARAIITSMCRGDAELVISPQAKLAVKFGSLFPGLTYDMLAITSRLLPSAENGQALPSTGLDSSSAASPSVITTLADRASERNNELKPEEYLA